MKIPSWLLAAFVLPVFLAAGSAAAAEGSRLTGRVVDAETLAPIVGATVELGSEAGGQGYFRARTDGHGGFALERIPAGRWYALTVGADGYADFVLGSWQFPETQRSVDVVVPLERAGGIEVRLTGPDGRTPLAGAQVTVRSEREEGWWEGFRPPPAPLFTDAQGVARFRDLPRGAWTVSAEAPARLPFEARRVNVNRGQTTTVSGRMARPASLSGTVRLADGTPIEGVAVSTQGSAGNTGQSGPGGEFTIADLPPGRFHLQVGHDGFEPLAAAAPIALAEGETRSGLALTVTPRPPELAFVLEREAFRLGQPVEVGVRSYRVGRMDCALYEIPAARLTDPARDFRALGESGDTSGLTAVARWTQVTPDGPPWSWREARMTLPEPMLPGAYLLIGRAGMLERRTMLFVTDLSLLVKRSPTQLLVSAASLENGAPVSDARVFVLPALDGLPPGQQWSTALRASAGSPLPTDAHGLLQLPTVSGGQRLRVVAISQAHGLAVADALLAPAAAAGGDRLFLYTDRPIYRPGQTLYWKAFARTAAGDGCAVPAPTGVAPTLTGPDGTTLDVPVVRLSERGSADGAVVLPADVPLGEWTLAASAGRARGTATVAVQEYRKPEFGVEVTPDREVYVNGDEVRFRVAATYFFGAPVFGARVRYNLFESRLAGASGGDWEEGGEEAAYGRMLKSGEARTDADGRVALPFTPARATYDRRLTLEVEVLDAAGRQVAARGRVVVGRGEFAVALRPLRRVLATGEAVGVEVTTRDHADRPVRAAVRVTLDQDAWNPIERRYTRSVRPLAEAMVNTDSLGRGFVSLSPAPARSGRLEIRARAQDARGAVITADGAVWMWDARLSDYAYRYPSLEAFADRERYQSGDTATIVVNTDARNAVVLAAVEGRDVEDVQVVPLSGHTGVLRFVMKPEYAPNVFLALHVRRGRDVQTRTLELAVAAARHDLKIALACDRTEYRPGAPAKVAVRTTDAAGHPASAELSLGVVDEAIYSLRADDTPDAHDVFYGRRPDWVTTVFSFPTLYYGGAAKGEPRELRKDFRDVAWWAPTVQTDAGGRAEVAFTWPDNLTTWRLTARGATAATLVGQATAKTRVSRDLVARLAGPRALVAGDEATLVSVATNRTTSPLTGVEEKLEVADGPLRLGGPPTRRADLPAGGEARGEWPVIATAVPANADTIPPGTLRFEAVAKSDRDALEVPVPVLPRAVPLHLHDAGVLDGDVATLTVPLPDALVRPGSALTLELSPSPAAMALGALDYLTGYEWGCTEQTANAIRPVANLLATAKRLGFTPPRAAVLEASLKPALGRLLALQRDDGGWGWWSEGEADPYLTMLALDALARIRLAGSGDERLDQALQRGVWRVQALLDGVRSADGEAYALMHLGGLPSLPIAAERFPWLRSRLEDLGAAVYGERERLGDAGLAMGALGQMNLQRPTEAKALVATLSGRATRGGGGTHWGGGGSEWWSDDVETTAYALSALLAVAPDDPHAADVLRWLAARREGDHWGSTRTTAPVAIALADWMVAHPAEVKPDSRVTVEWNGAPLLERAFGADDLFGRGAQVRVGGARLQPGANRLVLRRQGTGPLYWSWTARALVASPGPATDTTRLAVTREYLHAERTADRRGRPRWLATPLTPDAALHVGEAVLVRLTLHAAAALDHLMIEDPRPAGFEVDALLPEGTEHPWDLHAEARDTRAVFFLGSLPAGDTVIEYLVRPELAGRLVALPTTASGMYEPELEVRGPEQVLVVGAGR